jgi:hypothetical protein
VHPERASAPPTSLTGKARTLFWRAKTDFLASGRYIENDGFFWKLAESLSDRAQAA